MLAELEALFALADPDAAPEELTITHAGRTLTAHVYLTRYQAPLDLWGDGLFRWQAEWVADDPLRYAAPVVVAKGFAQLLGGLEFDLFTDGEESATVVRTNLCTNPSFETGIGGWAAENGAVFTRDTTAPISGTASAKMTNGGDAYLMVAVLAGDTVTLSFDYTTVGTVTSSPRLYLAMPGSAGVYTSLPLTQVAPGRYSVTATAVSAGAAVCAIYSGSALADVVHFDNVLIEKSATPGPYFDGDTPDTAHMYAWTGAAPDSTSTDTYTVNLTTGEVTGLLEYGDPGTETGMVDVTNTGTAPAWLKFTVTGPTPAEGFDILVAGDRLRYSAALSTGQTLVINTADGTVLLDGADRRVVLTVREWRAVAPGETATVVFTPLGGPTSGQLSVSLAPTFW